MTTAARKTVGWETITPAMAEKYLGESINDSNRHIRKSVVERYARDMANGKWTESNDAVTFDVDGRLLNGQHRLSAIVKTGLSMELLVARGLPRQAQVSMDTGSGRNLADHLHMGLGMAHAVLAASVSRQMVIIELKLGGARNVSREEQVDWLERNPALADTLVTVGSLKGKADINPTGMAIAHFMIARENGQELADLYLSRLVTPANEREGSAVFAVMSRVRNTRAANERRTALSQANLLIRGWNHWAKDSTVKYLAYTKAERALPAVEKWSRPLPA